MGKFFLRHTPFEKRPSASPTSFCSAAADVIKISVPVGAITRQAKKPNSFMSPVPGWESQGKSSEEDNIARLPGYGAGFAHTSAFGTSLRPPPMPELNSRLGSGPQEVACCLRPGGEAGSKSVSTFSNPHSAIWRGQSVAPPVFQTIGLFQWRPPPCLSFTAETLGVAGSVTHPAIVQTKSSFSGERPWGVY